MTEQNLPEEGMTVQGEDAPIPDEGVDAVPPEALDQVEGFDPEEGGEPADGVETVLGFDPAETTDPDDPGVKSDQTLRDETAEERYLSGDEQIPPDEPTIGEAAGDVDFGPMDPSADEVDGSDDAANRGGSPLSQFRPDE